MRERNKSIGACIVLLTLAPHAYASTDSLTLEVLSWEGYLPEAQEKEAEQHLSARFNRPIDINQSYIQSEEQLYSDMRNGKPDVGMVCLDHMSDPSFNFATKKLILPISEKEVPNLKNVDPQFLTVPTLRLEGKNYVAPYTTGSMGIYYRVESFPNPPTSLADFFPEDAAKQKKFGFIEFDAYSAMMASQLAGRRGEQLSNLSGILEDKNWQKWYRELILRATKLLPALESTKDITPELDFFIGWGYPLLDLNKRGQKWMVFLSEQEGYIGWMDSWVLNKAVRNRKDPQTYDVALEFMNFTLSEQFQKGIAEMMGSAPTATQARSQLVQDVQKKPELAHLAALITSKSPRSFITQMERRQRNGFTKYWKDYAKERQAQQSADAQKTTN